MKTPVPSLVSKDVWHFGNTAPLAPVDALTPYVDDDASLETRDTEPDVAYESPALLAWPAARTLGLGVALACSGMAAMTYAVESVGPAALVVLAGGVVYGAGVLALARAVK